MTAAIRQLTCREVVDFLDAYVANELPAGKRVTFDAHVAGCAECAAFLREYRATIRLAKGAFDDATVDDGIPEQLVRAILAARRGET